MIFHIFLWSWLEPWKPWSGSTHIKPQDPPLRSSWRWGVWLLQSSRCYGVVDGCLVAQTPETSKSKSWLLETQDGSQTDGMDPPMIWQDDIWYIYIYDKRYMIYDIWSVVYRHILSTHTHMVCMDPQTISKTTWQVNEELQLAVRNNDVDGVKAAIEEGADVPLGCHNLGQCRKPIKGSKGSCNNTG